MSNRIPKQIQALLERAEELRDQADQQQAMADAEKAAEMKRQRDQEWSSLLLEGYPQLPKELRRYARQPEVDINFGITWKQRVIPIWITGLAPFIAIFEPSKQEDGVHLELEGYHLAMPVSTRFDESGEIIWSWNRSEGYFDTKTNVHALEGVLLKARDLMKQFQLLRYEEEELMISDAQRNYEHQHQQDQVKAEEDRLLEEIKKDPIAVQLMKALVLIQQERSGLITEIENANDATENVESRLSEKLASLRRQADEARSEAEDERRRKEDLQDELDKAEKKAKRGW